LPGVHTAAAAAASSTCILTADNQPQCVINMNCCNTFITFTSVYIIYLTLHLSTLSIYWAEPMSEAEHSQKVYRVMCFVAVAGRLAAATEV